MRYDKNTNWWKTVETNIFSHLYFFYFCVKSVLLVVMTSLSFSYWINISIEANWKKGKLQNVQWYQWLKGYNKVNRLERVSPFPIHDLNQLSLHAEFVVFYKLLSLLPNLISMDSFSATILVVISTLISKEAKIFTKKASISVASDVKSEFVDWQVSNRPPRQTVGDKCTS